METISYDDDDDRETQLRQRLVTKVPPPKLRLNHQDAQSIYIQEIQPTVLKEVASTTTISDLREQTQKTLEEIHRRWKEDLSEQDRKVYQDRWEEMKIAVQENEQLHRKGMMEFNREFKDVVELTTKKNSIVHFKAKKRYPDHEFAINESKILINWPLVNCFLLCLDGSSSDRIAESLIAETNIPGVIPHFVDSDWMGWDFVVDYSAAKKPSMTIFRRKKKKRGGFKQVTTRSILPTMSTFPTMMMTTTRMTMRKGWLVHWVIDHCLFHRPVCIVSWI